MLRFIVKCQEQNIMKTNLKQLWNDEVLIMNSIKKILFGIALMIFGFGCVYVGALTEWTPAQIVGLISPVVGIVFAIAGYFEKEE